MWATWKLICLGLCLHTCYTMVLGGKSAEETEREYFAKFQKAFNVTSDDLKKMSAPSVDIAATPPRPFKCDTSIPQWYSPATKITELTPWDISIIGALGDSVTAGFGADGKNIIDDLIEYRRLSWSIGGDKTIAEVSTLPNIIKAYNDKLKGYSTRGIANNNVAKSGAKAPDMRGQAEDLLRKMKESESSKDLENQWKIITIWIGGNDLCATCDGTPEGNAEKYTNAVKTSLDFISENFKRTFVNLVDMIDITQLMELEGFWCSITHSLVCSCATSKGTKQLVKETAKQYNVALKNMLEEMNYYTRDDFTVALHPFFSDTLIPRKSNGKADSSYFAPDCFHFSTKGHGVGALYLWNNMLEKQGEKTNYIDWNNVVDYICISEEYRYFTVDKTAFYLKKASHDDDTSTDLVPVTVGSALAVLVVVIAAIAVVAVVVHRWKKKSSELSLEKLQLISVKV